MYYTILTLLPLFQQSLMQLFMVGLGVFVTWNFNRVASANKTIKYLLLILCIIGMLGELGSFTLQILIMASGSALNENSSSQEYSLSRVIFIYMSSILMPALIAILAYMRFKK